MFSRFKAQLAQIRISLIGCILALMLVFSVSFNVSVSAQNKLPPFPARQLLKAIQKLDEEGDKSSPVARYLEYRRLNPEAPAVEWDPLASPTSTKSWLFLNLDGDILERLENNLNEKGQPLL